MIDSTKTMRQLCDDEPQLEGFLVSKGLPFSLENPIVDIVTFGDVSHVLNIDQDEFVAEFERYKQTAVADA